MTRMEIEKKLEKSQKKIQRLEKKIRSLETARDLKNIVAELERRIANLEVRSTLPLPKTRPEPLTDPWRMPAPENPWFPGPNPHWIDSTPFIPLNENITTCQA